MQYQCTECNHHFDDQTAYCEDWSKPEKSFGCPSCKSFFFKNTRSTLKQSVTLGVLSGGVLLPALILTITSLVQGNTTFMLYGAAILISGAGIIGLLPKVKTELRLAKQPTVLFEKVAYASSKKAEAQQA